MPLSTNAPFNEFGHSMVLRDLEQLWLSLGGVGTGSAGDGQTQDQAQAVSQETINNSTTVVVKNINIQEGAITGDKIAEDTITAENIEPGTLTSTELEPSGVTPGEYGDSSHVPVFTVDIAGRITAVAEEVLSGLPSVGAADEGKILYVTSAGSWSASRDTYLGLGPLAATSTQGSFGVVKSSDGDYIKLSSGGIEIFDRSVSTGTALIKIDIGHASLTATGRALTVREIDVCDAGTAKKMLVLGSAPY